MVAMYIRETEQNMVESIPLFDNYRMEVFSTAVGVGACNVEQADATSGIPVLTKLQERIHSGWAKRKQKLDLPGWHVTANGLWTNGSKELKE